MGIDREDLKKVTAELNSELGTNREEYSTTEGTSTTSTSGSTSSETETISKPAGQKNAGSEQVGATPIKGAQGGESLSATNFPEGYKPPTVPQGQQIPGATQTTPPTPKPTDDPVIAVQPKSTTTVTEGDTTGGGSQALKQKEAVVAESTRTDQILSQERQRIDLEKAKEGKAVETGTDSGTGGTIASAGARTAEEAVKKFGDDQRPKETEKRESEKREAEKPAGEASKRETPDVGKKDSETSRERPADKPAEPVREESQRVEPGRDVQPTSQQEPTREPPRGEELRQPERMKEVVSTIEKDVRQVATPPNTEFSKQRDEAKVEPKIEPRVETKVEQRAEVKSEPRIEAKSDLKTEQKSEVRPEPQAERKVEAKSDQKVEIKNEPKVDIKPEPRVEIKSEPKIEVRSEPRIEPRQEQRVEPKLEKVQEQQIQKVIERVQNELQTANALRTTNEQAIKAAESIREIVTKSEQPTAGQIKDIIRGVETEKSLTIADVVQAKTQHEMRIERIVGQIENDLKGLAVASSSGGNGDKGSEKSIDSQIQKIIDKIEREIHTAVSPSSTGEQAAKSLDTIKEIVARGDEALTAKQLQEIIKAIDGERPAIAAKLNTEIDRELTGKATNSEVQKLVDKIEKEVQQANTVPSEENLRKLEVIRDILAKNESITPQVLQEILKAIEAEKPQLPIEVAKQAEEMTQPPMTKQEAMQALLSLVVDAQRLSTELVGEVRVETENKLSQIQGSVDELLRLRIEQFIALSAYQEGIQTADMMQLMQETLQELATRYALTDEQRQLLSRILVALSSEEFRRDDPNATEPKDQKSLEEKLKLQADKLKEVPQLREATKEEIARARLEELKELEELLKGREEIRLQKAEKRLKELMKEELDPNTKYMIDEDLEVIKVFKITGRVVMQKSRTGIQGVNIVGGLLGVRKTDDLGYFEYVNVPEDTVYMIGADSLEYTFKPSFHADTLTGSIYIEFIARPLTH